VSVLKEEGPLRKWLRERQPLLKRVWSPEIVGVKGVDAVIERLKEEKKAEWRRRGYSESLISMAIDLADSWTVSMTAAFGPPELREAMTRYIYPKSLEVASRWIERIGEAAKTSISSSI